MGENKIDKNFNGETYEEIPLGKTISMQQAFEITIQLMKERQAECEKLQSKLTAALSLMKEMASSLEGFANYASHCHEYGPPPITFDQCEADTLAALEKYRTFLAEGLPVPEAEEGKP